MITIAPAKNILGAIRLPGDKSLSHRYAMLAAIANGNSKFHNFSSGDDCATTLRCVGQLGAKMRHEGETLEIRGCGPHLQAPSVALDCGNSGSTMRMLAGILAAQQFATDLVGDESLSRRPMARIIEPLTRMGAHIRASEQGLPPLHIEGGGALDAIDYSVPVASAQVKSAILFAGLFATGTTRVEEPLRTRDHTELALRAFGVEVQRSKNRVSITGGQALQAIEAAIPGDISSAAFFLCAAALFPGSNLVIEGVLLNPTRAALLDVLSALGARISVINVGEQHGELIGTVKIEHGRLRGAKITGGQSAALIDELPVLAAIAPYTQDGIEIRDARELRVKESDRIALVAKNLRTMGATVEEFEDGLRVPGDQKLHGADIDASGDHRIAMAFAIAALRASSESRIHGEESVTISFPQFFSMLEGVVDR